MSSVLLEAKSKWADGNWLDALALLQDHAQEQTVEHRMFELSCRLHTSEVQKHMVLISEFKEVLSTAQLQNVILSRVYCELAVTYIVKGMNKTAIDWFGRSIRVMDPSSDLEEHALQRFYALSLSVGQFSSMFNQLSLDVPVIDQLLNGYDASATDRLTVLESRLEILQTQLTKAIEKNQIESLSDHSELASLANKISAFSMSQLDQDKWVLERAKYKSGGFFVEFGATDGVALSNTYMLEKAFNWKGICCEPNPRLFKKLKINRGCVLSDKCVAAESGQKTEFLLADEYGTMMEHLDSDVHGTKRLAYNKPENIVSVETITLNDLLESLSAPDNIDYISIDTEGSEYEIIKNFDFKRWNVAMFTIEHNYTNMRYLIRELMLKHGYACKEMEFDDWYYKAE